MEPLPGNWSICIGSVFEDAVDQLSILGTIVPSQRKSKNTYQLIADEITEILTEQKKIESEFDESAISGNQSYLGSPSSADALVIPSGQILTILLRHDKNDKTADN